MSKEQKNILKKVHSVLDKLIEKFEVLSDRLETSMPADLSKIIGEYFAQIYKVSEVLAETEEVHGLELNNEYITEQEENIIEAIKAKDIEVVVEIIDFEILPMLNEWNDELFEIFGIVD